MIPSIFLTQFFFTLFLTNYDIQSNPMTPGQKYEDKNDTWTDSSRRNNIWSSFSSTDLHLGFLHHLFNMSNHIHLTIHLNQYIYQYINCVKPTHILVHSWSRPTAAGHRWTGSTWCTPLAPLTLIVPSQILELTLLPPLTNIRDHTACIFNTACTLTDIRAHTACIFKKY